MRIFLSLCCFIIVFNAKALEYTFKKLGNYVVAENSPEIRISPSAIIKMKNGELWAIFFDRGDICAPCAAYVAISKDEGKTWGKPIRRFYDNSPKIGTAAKLFRLPNSSLLLGILKAHFSRPPRDYFADAHKNRLRQYIDMELYISNDEGRSFQLLTKVGGDTKYAVITWASGNVIKLKNGDLLLPTYAYNPLNTPDAPVGSGFLRSTDDGKTWGALEVAFHEIPGEKPLNCNEAAYTVKDDGAIVGFARIDSRPVKYMYKTISRDNGKTWSTPKATEIQGICPYIIRLENGLYVMVCGVRNDPKCPQRPHIFLSEDGEKFQDMGPVYYSKPEDGNGIPDTRWWGTGSSQSLDQASKDSFYVIFEGADQYLSLPYRRYIDFNIFEAKRKKK